MRYLISCFWVFIACSPASIATEVDSERLKPIFFEVPDYATEIVNTKSNLFLNPENSTVIFNPEKIGVIGVGSAGNIDYAFISNEKRVVYVTSGEELLPGVIVRNIDPPNKIVELDYGGKIFIISQEVNAIDR